MLCKLDQQNMCTPFATREALSANGFVRFLVSESLPDTESNIEPSAILNILASECSTLPADEYGKNENRYRRHSRAVFLPWSGSIEWLPSRTSENSECCTEYYQGKFHPDFQGDIRLFPAVSETVLTNPSILRMIRNDFDLTFWDEFHMRQPMQLGISLIKMKIEIGQKEAYSTPNSLHQDGETFTFAHLIERDNCIGGENVIADVEHIGKTPDELSNSQIRSSFTLNNALDSYAVHDPSVSHYVAPIRPFNPNARAIRSIMLIDFTPLISEHQVS